MQHSLNPFPLAIYDALLTEFLWISFTRTHFIQKGKKTKISTHTHALSSEGIHYYRSWFMSQWCINLLWQCFWISASCSGNTMFEEEEAIWTANRTAWKLPVAYSWPGMNASMYLVVATNVFKTEPTIDPLKRKV